VTEKRGRAILLFDKDFTLFRTVVLSEHVEEPDCIVIYNNNIYISDTKPGNNVAIFSLELVFIKHIGDSLNYCTTNIAVDENNIYIGCNFMDNIHAWNIKNNEKFKTIKIKCPSAMVVTGSSLAVIAKDSSELDIFDNFKRAPNAIFLFDLIEFKTIQKIEIKNFYNLRGIFIDSNFIFIQLAIISVMIMK